MVGARAGVLGALALVDGTLVGFVAYMAPNPTSVLLRGALALDGGTSGDFVNPAQTNSPLIGAPQPRPPGAGSAGGAGCAPTAAALLPSMML